MKKNDLKPILKRISFGFCFCTLLLGVSQLLLEKTATAAPATQASTHAAMDSSANELAQLLSSYQSYQADFTQSTYNRAGKVLQQSQGSVKIVRPGRFRWQITQPVKQVIIANGNTLWVYDMDLAQASKQTLRQQGLSPAVLLSSNVTDLAQKFTIRKQGQWYELFPKQKKSNFPVIRLQFTHNKLTSLQMVNSLGQNNVFYFNNIIINQNLPTKWFEFSPPRKVNVLTQ